MDNIYIMRNFFAAVIHMAIDDWFKHPKCRDEVREFFRSDWGKECCDVVDLQAEDILDKLESGKINRWALEEEVA